MAIYSCNLRSIGRKTHKPGTAGAHIRYIGRPKVSPVIIAEHMPADPIAARTWMDGRERAARANARMIDKIRIALPRELTTAQRAELVRAFAQDLTGGRVPWFAAIHQTGQDAHNPHAHIAIHDRDIETGKRVLRLSDNARERAEAGLPGPKAVEWVRERWEVICNEALAAAGLEVRIDRRTLAEQGFDRAPTIHEGPRAAHINDNVARPKSKERVNGAGRVIEYPSIDGGRTRREFNAHIIDLNLERAARSGDPAKVIRAAFEKEQMAEDRRLEDRLALERRARTSEFRKTARAHAAALKQLQAERRAKVNEAAARVRESAEKRRRILQQRQAGERRELADRQSRFRIRLLSMIDVTGTTKRRLEAARKSLSATHRQERAALTDLYLENQKRAVAAVRARYDWMLAEARAERNAELNEFRQRGALATRAADFARQQREEAREHARGVAEAKIEAFKERGPLEAQRIDDGFARAVRRAAERQTRKGPGEGRERE